MGSALSDLRNLKQRIVKLCRIPVGDAHLLCCQLVQMGQPHLQSACLDLIQTEAQLPPCCSAFTAVIAVKPGNPGRFSIVGDNGAAIPNAPRFWTVERKAADIAEGSLPSVPRQQAPWTGHSPPGGGYFFRQCHDLVHLGSLSVQMHHQDCFLSAPIFSSIFDASIL